MNRSPSRTSLGWVEQLVNAGIVDAGAHESNLYVRLEPRLDGYEYNWARGGTSATSPTYRQLLPGDLRFATMLPFSAQVAGLSAQIAAGEVYVATIYVGNNDFNIRNMLGLSFDPDPNCNLPVHPFFGPLCFIDFSDGVVDSIFDAVASFQGAGANAIVVATLYVTLGDSPASAAAKAYTNADIRARAEAAGIAVVDPMGFLDSPSSTTENGDIKIGPVRIAPDSTASGADLVPESSEDATGPCMVYAGLCSTVYYNLNVYLHDGHPSTLSHGLTANLFLDALNDHYWLNLRKLHHKQILASAGL